MKQLVSNIIRKVLNEIENKNIWNAFDLDDIPIEDDDTETNHIIEDLRNAPKDKHALKKLILTRIFSTGEVAVDLNDIDVSEITDMSFLFTGKYEVYNKWTELTDCEYEKIYDYFTEEELAKFDVNIGCNYFLEPIFREREDETIEHIMEYIQPDVSEWDVSKVTDMHYMFSGCKHFNCNLNKWNIRNVKNMDYMFCECKEFNQPLNKWRVGNVMSFYCMFWGCEKFNHSLRSWHLNWKKMGDIMVKYNTEDQMFGQCGISNENLPGNF